MTNEEKQVNMLITNLMDYRKGLYHKVVKEALNESKMKFNSKGEDGYLASNIGVFITVEMTLVHSEIWIVLKNDKLQVPLFFNIPITEVTLSDVKDKLKLIFTDLTVISNSLDGKR